MYIVIQFSSQQCPNFFGWGTSAAGRWPDFSWKPICLEGL